MGVWELRVEVRENGLGDVVLVNFVLFLAVTGQLTFCSLRFKFCLARDSVSTFFAKVPSSDNSRSSAWICLEGFSRCVSEVVLHSLLDLVPLSTMCSFLSASPYFF